MIRGQRRPNLIVLQGVLFVNRRKWLGFVVIFRRDLTGFAAAYLSGLDASYFSIGEG